MKVSVFTPTHNTRWLKDCYESLKAQTYSDWEWIVLLNGGAKLWEVPRNDPRVIVKVAQVAGVGALKREACNFATGDILLELDHDDILHPDALAAVAGAFTDWPDVGLVYSDFAQVNEDATPNQDQFSAAHGWTYRKEMFDGQVFNVANAPEPYPQNVSSIYYAPNHLRAYRRTVYDAAGGHDPTFEIGDDQDLCSRMYRVSDCYHINGCLYFQRIHDSNTQLDPKQNAAIQVINAHLYERDVQANALARAARDRLSCYDLGSGPTGPAPGYVGIDMHDYGIPNTITQDVFEALGDERDGAVGVIRAVDFLEHIPPARTVELMNLVWRKLAHGGMLFSMTPSTDGRGAWQDPTHISFWNENSFWYYTRADKAQYVPEIECRFDISRLATVDCPDQIKYVQANLTAIHEGPRQFGLTFWS